jgi:hypothetical protein
MALCIRIMRCTIFVPPRFEMELLPAGTGADKRRAINLNILAQGMPAITPAFGAGCAEAGSVCLESQEHSCGVKMAVKGIYTHTYEVHWTPTDEQTRKCWNDMQDATEYGAYGIAFLLIREMTPFTIIERARKGPGFDYWLGYEDDILFQKKARLEVSGILRGTDVDVNSRAKQKLEQTTPSDRMGFPAYVVIVEFNQPTSKLVTK